MTKLGRSGSLPEYTTQKNHLLHSSVVDGLAFSWSNTTDYNYGQDDDILTIENTSTTHELIIDQIWCHSDTTTRVVIHAATASISGGSAITGRNLRRGSSNVAAATALQDPEVALDAIVYWAGSIPADNSTPLLVNSGLILELNDRVAVRYEDVGTEAYCTIIGHYEKS